MSTAQDQTSQNRPGEGGQEQNPGQVGNEQTMPEGAIPMEDGVWAEPNKDGSMTVAGPNAGEWAGIWDQVDGPQEGAQMVPAGDWGDFDEDTYWVKR